jgi:hypothetical protein
MTRIRYVQHALRDAIGFVLKWIINVASGQFPWKWK